MNQDEVARDNAQRIARSIDELPTVSDFLSEPNFKPFWAQVRAINEMFKTLRPVLREDRERLRAVLSQRCDVVKREQDRYFASRDQESSNKRELVNDRIREAMRTIRGAESSPELAQAHRLLQEAVGRMKDGWDGFNVQTGVVAMTQGRMLKKDRHDCWTFLNEARDELRKKTEQLRGSNDERFLAHVREAERLLHSGEFRSAKDKVQETQRAMKGVSFTSNGFDAVKSGLDSVWRRASEGQSQRAQEWRDRQQSKISRWLEARHKNEERLDHIEAQIEKCRNMLATARTREHEERVEGWIAENYVRLREIQGWNDDLDAKIASVRDKLRD